MLDAAEAAWRINLLARICRSVDAGLTERNHAALVQKTLGARLVGHNSRDVTTIEAREKPVKQVEVPEVQPTEKKKRRRSGKGETRAVARRSSSRPARCGDTKNAPAQKGRTGD